MDKILNDNHILIYEGFVRNGKPYGPGKVFFPDGKVYQEGLFDIKGLICGREYYPDGQLRFEGLYEMNRAYGPDYPIYGSCFDMDGNQIYKGILAVRKSGIGYPSVIEPEGYGNIVQKDAPEYEPFMWQDMKSGTGSE